MENELGLVAGSVEALSSLYLQEAHDAGLISDDLPIFNSYGEIDPELLNKWSPTEDFKDLGIVASVLIPKHSAAAIFTTLKRFEKLKNFCNVNLIARGQEGNSRFGQAIISGNIIAKYGTFRSTLVIYSPFDEAVMIPIVGGIKGHKQGLSMATYSVVHALGHIMYGKLNARADYEALGEFHKATGWSRASLEGERGSFLNQPSPLSWRRDARLQPVSETGQYSPADEFAEMVALHLLHNTYLSVAFPDKAAAIEDIFMKYNLDGI